MKDSFQEVEDIQNMDIKGTAAVDSQKTVLSERMHPGFPCFFQKYLAKVSMTFDECYQLLVEGSNKMANIKLPAARIFAQDLKPEEKIEMLEEKTNENTSFIYIYKDPESQRDTSRLIDFARDRRQQIDKLQAELTWCELYKRKLLAQKKEEFREKWEQEERQRRQEEQKILELNKLREEELAKKSKSASK